MASSRTELSHILDIEKQRSQRFAASLAFDFRKKKKCRISQATRSRLSIFVANPSIGAVLESTLTPASLAPSLFR
jgi:hypothetical protein